MFTKQNKKCDLVAVYTKNKKTFSSIYWCIVCVVVFVVYWQTNRKLSHPLLVYNESKQQHKRNCKSFEHIVDECTKSAFLSAAFYGCDKRSVNKNSFNFEPLTDIWMVRVDNIKKKIVGVNELLCFWLEWKQTSDFVYIKRFICQNSV